MDFTLKNNSFMKNPDWNTQRYLISHKMLTNLTQKVNILQNSIKTPKYINSHLSLYKNLNNKQKKINLNPLKFYNFININFYNTYDKWFSKHLTIIGYQISEYSLDLKLTNILSQKKSLLNENIKIESKKKYKLKRYTFSLNKQKWKKVNLKKNLKILKQSRYRLLIPFKKKKRKNLSLRRGKIILHKKRIFKKKKKLFFKKKNFRKFKTLKWKSLSYFFHLQKYVLKKKFKKKTLISTFYETNEININNIHQNSYNFLNKPKTYNLNDNLLDYISNTLK
jgi:hypothetical protein